LSFKKKLTIIIIVILVTLLLGGCTNSKKSYQDKMTKILIDTQEELSDLSKKSGEDNKSRAELDKEQIKILEDTEKKMEKITPPEDFFSGHADLIQFLSFYVDGKEIEIKLDKSESEEDINGEQQISPERTESLKMTMAANRALGRAARELPFLEFYLLETFGQLAGGPGVGTPQPRTISPPSPSN